TRALHSFPTRRSSDLRTRIEKDLSKPELKELVETKPKAFRGYSEADEPNFSFSRPPCSFYSGTKALAEEAIADVGQSYIWRLRIDRKSTRLNSSHEWI